MGNETLSGVFVKAISHRPQAFQAISIYKMESAEALAKTIPISVKASDGDFAFCAMPGRYG